MALAVFDFPAPRFITYVGFIALGALAIIFLLQGMSELLHNARFSGIVYRLLGQRLEGWLVDLFLLWCVAVLLSGSRGRTRMVGSVALAAAVAVELYANWLSYSGTSLNVEAPALKPLVLLPVAWLLLESKKAPLIVRPDRQTRA